jgi:tetratricopeptide (TPR) repeat protein
LIFSVLKNDTHKENTMHTMHILKKTRVKILFIPLSFLLGFLYLTEAIGQTNESRVIKEINSIEAILYQNPLEAKLRLQKLVANNPDISDSTKSSLYLKWGVSLGMNNNLDSAIWAIKKSYALSPDYDINKSSALRMLATLYRLKKNYKEAEKALIESLRLNKSIGKNPMQEVIVLQEYGSLCLDQYDYARSTNFYLQALDILQTPGLEDPQKVMIEAKLRITLAEAYLASGNYSMAIREFELSMPVLDSLQDNEGMVRSGYQLGTAYIASKQYIKADSLFNMLLPLTEKLQNDELKSYILLCMGNSLVPQGKLNQALSNFRKSFAIMNKNKSVYILDCVNPYIDLLIQTGAEAEARQVISTSSVQLAFPVALPKEVMNFKKSAIKFLWKDKTTSELHAYYQDLLQLSDKVYQEEKRKSALEIQAKYQFERQKEIEKSLLTENNLLKEKEGLKKIQLLLSIVIGLLACFILLLVVKRLQQLARMQKDQIAAKEAEIRLHEVQRESAEREKAFREQLIHQQKQIIAKNIEDADKLKEQLEQLVQEQQQSQRQELVAQFELIKQENLGVDLLITQFNALYPSFSQKLIRKFPKLSQPDVQFCIFVRMNLTTKEIAALLNIEPRSIYVKKYRVMEKMGLGENDDFEQLLYGIE